MKKHLLIFLLTLVTTSVFADDVRVTVSAPQEVEVGDQFRLEFKVNLKNINSKNISDINTPDFKGFEVLYGPSESFSNSVELINGRSTSSSSVTYTYILLCSKAGTYTIGSASVVYEGRTIKSHPVTIKVHALDEGQITRPMTTGSKDLFMTATANKTTVYEQEAILLTYKIYSLVNLTQLDGKLPSLNGFQIQELPLPRTKQFKIEQYNGRNYRTVVWSQYLLFPQKSGELVIPSITYEGVVQEVNRNIDPIEAFFNGMGGVIETKRKITTPKVVINVKPLADKPAGFSGGVGQFSVSSSINTTSVPANEALNLKVKVNGIGNMKLIGTPEVAFPKDFETYDAKVTDDFSITSAGLKGTREFEYLAVPRVQGEYTIPPVEFVYFDVASKTYKTAKTEPYTITVTPGKSGSGKTVADFTNTQRAVDRIGTDINHIKRGDTTLRKDKEIFFATSVYWLYYIVALIVFAVMVIVAKKMRLNNADVARSRGKRANKIAAKRLKLADKLLKERKRGEFYDEVLKALWGYIADKLNMPQEQLNKDNIRMKLEDKAVEDALIDEFIEALNNCEFARYAPGEGETAMESVYDNAMTVISKMENKIK